MKRLEGIISQIGECRCLADIGCDHGFVSLAAAKTAQRVFSTDISDACLSKARRLLCGLPNVEFFVGDGLKALGNRLGEVDCIVISGMGGHTICNVLSGYEGDATLVIQPQNNTRHVREVVANSGFVIKNDFLTYEKGKFYDIIVLKRGKMEQLSELQLCFGKFFDASEISKTRLQRLEKKFATFVQTQKNAQYLGLIRAALYGEKDGNSR